MVCSNDFSRDEPHFSVSIQNNKKSRRQNNRQVKRQAVRFRHRHHGRIQPHPAIIIRHRHRSCVHIGGGVSVANGKRIARQGDSLWRGAISPIHNGRMRNQA